MPADTHAKVRAGFSGCGLLSLSLIALRQGVSLEGHFIWAGFPADSWDLSVFFEAGVIGVHSHAWLLVYMSGFHLRSSSLQSKWSPMSHLPSPLEFFVFVFVWPCGFNSVI